MNVFSMPGITFFVAKYYDNFWSPFAGSQLLLMIVSWHREGRSDKQYDHCDHHYVSGLWWNGIFVEYSPRFCFRLFLFFPLFSVCGAHGARPPPFRASYDDPPCCQYKICPRAYKNTKGLGPGTHDLSDDTHTNKRMPKIDTIPSSFGHIVCL